MESRYYYVVSSWNVHDTLENRLTFESLPSQLSSLPSGGHCCAGVTVTWEGGHQCFYHSSDV